jgi:uncharacterized PurR-regulated membrane protein YhhQ (DUF165 family)
VKRLASIAAYLGSIVLANWLTARYGFVPIGFGLVATAGTYAAGFAFVARDAVQDAAGQIATLGALLAGCAVSWYVATPALALASAAAFGLSELADMAIYTPLRRRGYVRAALASNLVGTVVDTLAFLYLAGFGITTLVVAGQLVGKAYATIAVIASVGVGRALLRHRLNRAGA